MINAIQPGSQAYQVESPTRCREQAYPVNPSSSGDRVELSDASQLMALFFQGMGVDYTPGKCVSLSDIRTGLERRTEAFESRASELFLENSISLDPPAELTTDGSGNVRVKGDHPQKEEIEQLFADNPDLANEFRGLSAQSSLVEAAAEYEEFAKLYEQDPYAAVARYAHLFNGLPKEEFSLVVGEERSPDPGVARRRVFV